MTAEEIYLPLEEVKELTGWSRAWIYEQIKSGQVAVKRGDASATKGKAPLLVWLLSLPVEAQRKYWEKTAQQTTESSQLPNLAEVPARVRQEALDRLPIVQDAVSIMESRDAVSTRIKAFAQHHHISTATLYSWVKAYRERSFPGLLPSWGKKAGQFYAISDALKGIIQDEYLRPSCPSVTTVQRNIEKFCERARILPIPCVATINRYLATIPHAVVIARRHGEGVRASWCTR